MSQPSVQRLRQGYKNELEPTFGTDGFYMYYADHAFVVSLLREQLTKAEEQLVKAERQCTRLMNIVDRIIEEQRGT